MGIDKRGQITLFIIIAIVVVVLVVFAILFWPKVFVPTVTVSDPEAYISDCLGVFLEPLVENISSQGGYLEAKNCIFYKDICRHYLCYATMPYTACVNQEPLLKEHVENLLKNKLQQGQVVLKCLDGFRNAATMQGYDVSTCSAPKFNVTLTEGKINVPIECEITMSKGQEVRRFEKLKPFLKWPLYDFIKLTETIISEEIEKKDFDPLAYMLRHYEIEVEKFQTSDGSKIFILRERATDREFVFAIRNYVHPPGVM